MKKKENIALNEGKKCQVSDQDRAFYKKNGYLIIRNVLTEKECIEYIEEAHRVSKGTVQEPNLYRKSDKFLEMARDQRIMDYADSLLEWRMIPIGDIFFFAKSSEDGKEGSSPHQDNSFQKLNGELLLRVEFIWTKQILTTAV